MRLVLNKKKQVLYGMLEKMVEKVEEIDTSLTITNVDHFPAISWRPLPLIVWAENAPPTQATLARAKTSGSQKSEEAITS